MNERKNLFGECSLTGRGNPGPVGKILPLDDGGTALLGPDQVALAPAGQAMVGTLFIHENISYFTDRTARVTLKQRLAFGAFIR